MERPTKTKEEFVAEERAAERNVVLLEFELKKAEATNDVEQIAEAQAAVVNARKESLKIRADMQKGLEQWHAWDSEQELERTARELGIG